MTHVPTANEDVPQTLIGRTRTIFLIEGIVLLILGAAAIFLPMVAALAVTILLGWVFLFSGVIGLIGTLGARRMPGFWWSLVSALTALAAGAVLIGWPVSGVIPVTLVLSIFFILDGFFSVMFAVEHRRQLTGRWGWMMASGVVTLLLAAFILAGLPATTVVLGIVVGIDMIFAGAALLAIGANLRAQA